MTKYVLYRTGQALIVLWAAFTLSFILLQALPGDAVLIKFLNPEYGLSPEQISELRAVYAADGSVLLQYFHALGNFLRGEFGYSIQADVPVAAQLATNIPPTLKLALLGFSLAALLAVLITLLSALAPFRWLRNLIQSLPPLLISLPVFWLGIMLIQIFSFRLKLVSVINPGPWESLVLPVFTLAAPIAAPLAQIMIRSLDEVETRPFIAVARAKGASHWRVLWAHVARNALLPVLTIAGVLLGELLAGAVVTETVFGLNGIGGLTIRAVANQDVAVLQAIVVFCAAVFVTVNLAIDLVFPFIDPRLKSQDGAKS